MLGFAVAFAASPPWSTASGANTMAIQSHDIGLCRIIWFVLQRLEQHFKRAFTLGKTRAWSFSWTGHAQQSRTQR